MIDVIFKYKVESKKRGKLMSKIKEKMVRTIKNIPDYNFEINNVERIFNLLYKTYNELNDDNFNMKGCENMISIKKKIIETVDKIPENASIEDAFYIMYINLKIKKSEDDINNNNIITLEELDKELGALYENCNI